MNSYQLKHKDDPEYKAKNAARARRWYEENKERAQARINERAKATRAEKAAYDKAYYQKNKEKKVAYYKTWRAANPSKPTDNVRQWRRAHPIERRLQSQARRAKTNGVKIIKEDIHNWDTRICGVCNEYIEDKFHIDHIIPLAKGGPHSQENLQLTHPVCNMSKGARLLDSASKW